MQQWQIGKISITRILEMEIAGGTQFILPDATQEACKPIEWLQPHFMDAQGNLIMSIHALVIDTGKRRIIVDTCIGNDKQRPIPGWSNLQTSFLGDLEEAGYPRESIDTVLCTHLHVDHVGWNTMLVNGRWLPTFPNARYLIAEKEWRHWDSVDDDPLNENILADSVRPVFDAGLVDLIDWEHKVCDGVHLRPTPGHTPGHVSVHIESEGQQALITGDCIHHPCQMTRTDWCSSADYDQKEARATREAILTEHADGPTLIIGTHFATPTAGHVRKRSQGGYWFDLAGSLPD